MLCRLINPAFSYGFGWQHTGSDVTDGQGDYLPNFGPPGRDLYWLDYLACYGSDRTLSDCYAGYDADFSSSWGLRPRDVEGVAAIKCATGNIVSCALRRGHFLRNLVTCIWALACT